jgi:hypothetical protein
LLVGQNVNGVDDFFAGRLAGGQFLLVLGVIVLDLFLEL